MMTSEVHALTGHVPAAKKSPEKGCGPDFGDLLRQKLESGTNQVGFSKHAIARAEERGVEMTPELLGRLTGSVELAQAKGATNIVALDRSLAFIINVPNNRVITLMRQDEMKENIFTNIDGAVLL